ncbi:MAG: hypothetical protein ABH876_01750 [Patescibacteria group bacterium]|nr:hypothetical protein [Patescibacteria group bacterium]MBU1877232.1 hypothetical protein [Patescibacteria group bacterium]
MLITSESFLQLFLESFVENLPNLIWAIWIFIIGLFVSKWVGNLVSRFLEKIQLGQAIKRMDLEERLMTSDTYFNVPKFFGRITSCFVTLLFLMASAEIIGLLQFSQLLAQAIAYFPNIFIASLIFITAVFISDFSQKIMIAVLEKEKITYSRFLGRIIRWIIWSLSILAILYQLQIAPDLIMTIFIGFIGTIVIAVGIAFGLGGKDIATKILKEFEEKIR